MTGPRRQGGVIATRPVPGTPRPYAFPSVHRATLSSGLGVAVAPMPGRGLVDATLVARYGAADEPPELGGAAVLAARALTEGTETRDAIALVEAAERLGASLHAEAGWDATSVGLDVPAGRLAAALELLAEVVRRPAFPGAEIERLRDERLTDILQARADPRRRADEAFAETIYSPSSPYRRPAGGLPESVAGLGRDALRRVHGAGLVPGRAMLAVAGDVDPAEVIATATALLEDWTGGTSGTPAPIGDAGAVAERFVRVVHRPKAVQTEIRVGHPGLPRRHPDFHAVSVMGAILGGLFNSRLNMKLREEKGYTYGAGAGFELRRGRGPFSARAAVSTEVTVPAVADLLAELERIREAPVLDAELRAARDYLIGVFPLRFETPGPVAAALSGLFIHELPDDELAAYREGIEAVSGADVLRVARAHLAPERSAIVLVGDHEAFGAALDAAGLGAVHVERDPGPVTDGRLIPPDEDLGPVDTGRSGPTEGADESGPSGSDEPSGPGDSAGDVAGDHRADAGSSA
jgi:zinc protease